MPSASAANAARASTSRLPVGGGGGDGGGGGGGQVLQMFAGGGAAFAEQVQTPVPQGWKTPGVVQAPPTVTGGTAGGVWPQLGFQTPAALHWQVQ